MSFEDKTHFLECTKDFDDQKHVKQYHEAIAFIKVYMVVLNTFLLKLSLEFRIIFPAKVKTKMYPKVLELYKTWHGMPVLWSL